jgi:hypothetical protein
MSEGPGCFIFGLLGIAGIAILALTFGLAIAA